jgi:hypothetical protein
MSTKRIPTDQIGADLVEASRRHTEESLPLSTKLFPYIYVASRRMSLRTISRWLQEKHGVSLSAAAISRALNSQNLHLERLAESIAPPALYVATAYGFSPHDLLYREVTKNCSELQLLADHTQPDNENDIERWDEMQTVAGVWLPIPHEVQLLLEPYLIDLWNGKDDDDF